MRIAYVCMDAGIPVFGTKGCSIHVQEILRALRSEENPMKVQEAAHSSDPSVEVHLFATRRGGEPPADLADLPVHWLASEGSSDTLSREKAALGLNRQLTIALAKTGPWDAIYERYSLWSHAAMRFAEEECIPGVLEVNAPLIDEQRKHRELVDAVGAATVAREVMSRASAVIAVSPQVASYVGHWRGHRNGVEVIPNGVAIDRYLPRYGTRGRPDHSDVDRRTIGFVGSLKPWHGLEDLAEAFSALRLTDRRARLLIVGDGPARSIMMDRLSPAARDATQFSGHVPHAEIPHWLAQMDVAVAPYPPLDDFYFSPLKILEYMAAGLPIIASDVGDLADFIAPPERGWIYRAGDVAALTASLRESLDEVDSRANMGRAAREFVTRRHTWRHVASRIMAHMTDKSLRSAVRTA